MPVASSFLTCVVDQLRSRGFGDKRIKDLTNRLEGLALAHERAGLSPHAAQVQAAAQMYKEVDTQATERAKRALATLAANAGIEDRVAQGLDIPNSALVFDGKRHSRGVGLARGAISLIEDDPRFKGTSYSTDRETYRNMFIALFDDTLLQMGKGSFGRQRGKAHLPNVVDEIFGVKTGDKAAAGFAQAYTKIQNLMVDTFNAVGGSLSKLSTFRLPQRWSTGKLIRKGWVRFHDVHMRTLDWGAVRYPDGSPIPAGDRAKVLRHVYDTLSTNGASKIEAGAMQGRGRALGNMLEKHRFLVYKDAAGWKEAHAEFGEGNVFDVMIGHIEDMSHRIAMVKTFGPNPELARQAIHNSVRRQAAALGGRAVLDAEGILKNKLDPMFDMINRNNPIDPENVWGATVSGTSNTLTSAILGSASFLAIPGDFLQTIAVRALNRMRWFGGVDFYLRSLVGDRKNMELIAIQSGFVHDETIMTNYAVTRLTGAATYGPSVTRRLADINMRASLMSGHTRSARWANQAEFMGLLARDKGKAFNELPYRWVMERYGISEADWKTFSTLTPHQPVRGVHFMRPLDLVRTGVKDGGDLYRKFQGMIFEESRKMVPEATVEGQIFLKGTSRPDTLRGAIMHSYAMFKNFPVSIQMTYGRLALATPNRRSRIAFIAGMGAALTLTGAIGTQLREISKGRDPLPMDTLSFLGKAMLSGGGLSIFGDYMFSGINEYGRGVEDQIGGPIVGLTTDLTQLALGDVFKWADTVGGLAEPGESNFGVKAAEFAKRYTPLSSVWWARALLERHFFDAMKELADPIGYQRQARRQVRTRREDYGQEYWWAPGEGSPDRAPSFEGVIR